MLKVMIIGGGQGGLSIMNILRGNQFLEVVAIIDINLDAPAIKQAKKEQIVYGRDWKQYLNNNLDIIIDVTGNPVVFEELKQVKQSYTIIPGAVAHIIVNLIREKENLIENLKYKSIKDDLIFKMIHDGMLITDPNGVITSFNRELEGITELPGIECIGKNVQDILPEVNLLQTLKNRDLEINKELILANGKKVLITKIPIIDEEDTLLGAFAIFKDLTEILQLAGEISNLKEVQTMLEAIILSSNDAISVVDENGLGTLINPAYTRLTGLKKEDVIGQPATIDISEGESMHLQVLKTKKPVRGVKMLVGPNRREVIVNVAPILVDQKLKGSVAVIHDTSEIKALNEELQKAKERIRTLEAKYTFEDIIGTSEEMEIAILQAKVGAKTPATVLLRGESGTGKELFAHAIHNESDRKYQKFIRVNCAALTESLLESELFGYVEGAFSGAKRGGKRGLFEEANHGSIFLDEIGELSLNTQAKLLRVLQEKEIVKVGDTKTIPIDVRIIAATNRNLEEDIANGKFRSDLYYRLNRFPIHIPPLRNRLNDISLLCQRLIQKISLDYGKRVEGITSEAIQYLQTYDWPGNVRELENVIGRAIIFMKNNENMIDVHHLPSFLQKEALDEEQVEKEFLVDTNISGLQNMIDNYEKKIISHVLKKNGGNKTKTAQQLGVSVRNLYYKMQKYSL